MVKTIVFDIIYFMAFIIISGAFLLKNLYIVQLNEYKIKSVLFEIKDLIVKNIIWIFPLIGIYLIIKSYNIDNIILIVVLICFALIYTLHNLSRKTRPKTKYTKRMIRIFSISVLIILITAIVSAIFIGWIDKIYVIIFIEFLLQFSILLSVCILLPFDKIINRYYINKAKNKLKFRNNLIKIGITGSFGKTSVKEILYTILKEKYAVLKTPNSFNTPLGISKTINEGLNANHKFFVCEMGAKKRGEIKHLCKLVDVDYGIVTNVGRQHTSTFGNIENIYATKKELPDYLSNKFCVFNIMNSYTKKMFDNFIGLKFGVFVCIKKNKVINNIILKNYKILRLMHLEKIRTYYEYPRMNCYYAKSLKCDEFGSKFKVFKNQKLLFETSTKLLGVHNVINILLAVAMACNFNMNYNDISCAIKKLEFISSRLEKLTMTNGSIVINNGYNSNIDCVLSTVKTLNLFDRKNKIIVTPGLIDTENDYDVNYRFGKIISNYCTGVVIVKEKNYSAIFCGLKDAGFNMENVKNVVDFSSARKIMEKSNDDSVFLIENDLPDNYR